MFRTQLRSAAAVLLLAIALVAAATGVLAARGAPAEPPAPARPEGPGPGADAGAKPGADTGKPIRSLPGHKDRLMSVAYSPDGRWIGTASWDGTARIWDAQTGQEVRRLDVPAPRDSNPAHPLSRILFSPDNQFAVTAQQSMPNEPGVIVWDRRTGERVRDFPGLCAAFSPDGKHLACGGYNSRMAAPVRLYEFATGKLVRELHSTQNQLHWLTFSRDGHTLFASGLIFLRPPRPGQLGVAGQSFVFRAWDVATGKERHTALGGADVLQRHALSPDGRTLVEAGTLVEMATGGGRGLLTAPIHEVYGVAFSPDGRTLATGGKDGTVRLWDLPSGKELGCFGKAVDPSKPGWVIAVAFSPDGRTLVSGGLDIAKGGRIPSIARIWDVSRITGRQRAVAERSAAELAADWEDLAGNAPTGYAALGRLVLARRSAVAFLGEQLHRIKPVDTKRVERLLADLDSDTFAVRERATRELEALAEHALPALRTALAGNPSLESRRRLEALLSLLESGSLSAETVRQIRAVEALESIGDPEARRLLAQLAAGPPAARLTQEAQASLGRLAKPPGGEMK